MGFFNKKVKDENQDREKIYTLDELIEVFKSTQKTSDYVYALAEAHAIDLIARTIAYCEIQVFEADKSKNIKETKGDLYWSLNISPNENENGASFIYKLVIKLLTDKKALILVDSKEEDIFLHIADEFSISNHIMRGKRFKNISIVDDEGNKLTLQKEYTTENAIYYTLGNSFLRTASEKFNTETQKILKAIQKTFILANTPKFRLSNSGGQARIIDIENGEEIDYKKYKAKLTEGLFSDEASVILLSQIFGLENLNKDNEKDLTDYDKEFINISNSVADSWDIPRDLFFGNITEKSNSFNLFVTVCLKYYFRLLEDGMNKVIVGKEDFIEKGEYIRFNTLNMMHKDLIDKASGWDKLISNGFSFNQLSKFLGLPTINEEWANKHYITKNYANVESEGGENKDG